MTLPKPPRITPTDVPMLRRELAAWYGGPRGTQYYYGAIQIGRQPIRPPGPPEQAAAQLASAEATRLIEGELWYVDEDLCALLAAAHPSMPRFAPRPSDLPSLSGFVVFAQPIAQRQAVEDFAPGMPPHPLAAKPGEPPLGSAESLRDHVSRTIAVSWGPTEEEGEGWAAGGIWMSFYTNPAPLPHIDDPERRRRAQAQTPPLSVDNEAVIAWRPEGAPTAPYLLPDADGRPATLVWARMVFAAFQLAGQANLTETDQPRTPRAERRRTQRAGLPERDVRLVRLRRTLARERDSDQPTDAGPQWRHRWVVRGHWRNQWYPSIQDHRPKWIAPYLKGPANAPVLGGDKVTVVSPPPATDPQTHE